MCETIVDAAGIALMIFAGIAILIIISDWCYHEAAARKMARMPPIKDMRLVSVRVDSRHGRTFLLEAEDGETFHVRERMLHMDQREEIAVKLKAIALRGGRK